eukprot:symbB.v1.2.011085.t1/scaffold738.1/size167167/19
MVQGERCSTEFWQEESARQTTILREMGDYTFSIVKEVGESEGDVALHRPGRVIELPTGELVLRPYNVSEQSTQVIETDLLKAIGRNPVVLCIALPQERYR